IGAFDPEEGRAIIVPTLKGKRGNPILWAKRFFAQMLGIEGDVGARHLVGENMNQVFEVEMDDEAVLTDIDKPEDLGAIVPSPR
ncbi:MAG: 4-diphosphocytidyl-2C-methyl-D-erythritol kinase, partial [Rhodospirillales bacterium]